MFLGWNEDDQDKALAFCRVDADKCPGCKNPMSETTDFAKRASWQVETVVCHACRTRDSREPERGPGEFTIVTGKDDRG